MVKKIFSYCILPLCIAGLAYLCVDSVMQPVRFNKNKEYRESVGIERLKDIRTLQVAFKSENGKFASTMDSLKAFYNTGKIKVTMQIGSKDDSLAMANTAKIKRQKPRITPAELYQRYLAGESLVFSVEHYIPVKDTLFNNRPGFCIDSLSFIPFSGGVPVIMESAVKKVSGVNVPLFEAKMPYNDLLKGLDRQLIVNLNAEREDTGRYPGLMVGSITAPNNNAGNWE